MDQEVTHVPFSYLSAGVFLVLPQLNLEGFVLPQVRDQLARDIVLGVVYDGNGGCWVVCYNSDSEFSST